jgi:hypothetical protein
MSSWFVVEGPVRLLCNVDAIERRLGKDDLPSDELRHVAIHEREQQCRNVMTIRNGVCEEDDAAVPQLADLALADTAAERGHEIDNSLFSSTFAADTPPCSTPSPKRQNRLLDRSRPASLIRRPNRLDDEELASSSEPAVAELAGASTAMVAPFA